MISETKKEEKQKFDMILSKLNNRIQFIKQTNNKIINKEEEKIIITPEEREEAENNYKKGLEYQHKGRIEEAKKYYLKVLQINPHHLAAKIRLEQLKKKSEKK